jgi:hypothetical protein
MKRIDSIRLVFMAVLIAAVAIFAAASPPSRTDNGPAIKQSAIKAVPAVSTAVTCQEQPALNQELRAKVTGLKEPYRELDGFDFKLNAVIKPLAGFADTPEPVPVRATSGQPPIR